MLRCCPSLFCNFCVVFVCKLWKPQYSTRKSKFYIFTQKEIFKNFIWRWKTKKKKNGSRRSIFDEEVTKFAIDMINYFMLFLDPLEPCSDSSFCKPTLFGIVLFILSLWVSYELLKMFAYFWDEWKQILVGFTRKYSSLGFVCFVFCIISVIMLFSI